jgi:PAS domain S-box-containing protein
VKKSTDILYPGLSEFSLDSLTFFMVRTDIDGNYTYVNKKFIDVYGWIYPDGQIIGKYSLSSICAHDHAKVQIAGGECIADPGRLVKVEIDKPAKDGSIHTTIWDFICLTEKDGTPSELQCMGIDITDRIHAERDLKENVERLDSLSFITTEFLRQENWEDILLDVFELVGHTLKTDRVYFFENHDDPDTGEKLATMKVEWVNAGVSAELDNPQHYNMPHSLFEGHFDQLKRNMPYQAIVKHIKEDDFRINLESQQIKSILVIPVIVDGEFFGFIGVDDCHTERVWKEGEITYLRNIASSLSLAVTRHRYEQSLKKLNSELALSNQDLEQFAYVTSHDLQEPLRMVGSFLTLLENKYGDQLDDKALQYINFATDGTKKMRQIISDLLEFSKVGKYVDQPTSVPLNDVVSETLILYKRLILDKKAIINVGDLPTVTYFRTPISQIIQNMLSNALKYSKLDVPPIIEISAIEYKHDHEIMISDNGIGISPEFNDKIFVMFSRLNPGTDYTGTGIGLSIVKKIIDRMGGRIWVESVEGVGSTFHIMIPKIPNRE